MSLKESSSSTTPDDYYKQMETDAESVYNFLGNFGAKICHKSKHKKYKVIVDAVGIDFNNKEKRQLAATNAMLKVLEDKTTTVEKDFDSDGNTVNSEGTYMDNVVEDPNHLNTSRTIATICNHTCA